MHKRNKYIAYALVLVGAFLSLGVGLAMANTITILGSHNDNAYFAGNVGIGIANPTTFNLDVSQSARIGGTLKMPMLGGAFGSNNLVTVDSSGTLGSETLSDFMNNNGVTLPAALISHGVFGAYYNDNSPYVFKNKLGVGIAGTNPSATLEVAGTLRVSGSANTVTLDNLAGGGVRLVTVNNLGVLSATATLPGDNFGNHIATQNVQLGNYWLSGDGGSEGVFVNSSGNVGIGTNSPSQRLQVAGTIRTNLTGTGNRCLYVTPTGDIAAKTVDCGTSTGGDNLGSHIATQNIQLGNYWLSGDGGSEGVFVNSSGNVGIGTNAPGYPLQVNGNIGATAFIYTSDVRLKTEITTLDNSLDKISQLRGVSFRWQDSGQPSVGLVAQEVEKVFPELVRDSNGLKGVEYGNLVAPLIEAIKEQQTQIKSLSERLERLEAKK